MNLWQAKKLEMKKLLKSKGYIVNSLKESVKKVLGKDKNSKMPISLRYFKSLKKVEKQ